MIHDIDFSDIYIFESSSIVTLLQLIVYSNIKIFDIKIWMSEYLLSHITIFILKNLTITNRYLIW